MKVIWEHLKLTISFRFIAIITSLMIWGILPISLMMLKLTISRKKGDLTLGDIVLFGIFIGFIFIVSYFSEFTLPKISLLQLFKLNSLLKHGIYTKAKVIDIQETKKRTTFYLQLMDSEYNSDILEYKISFFKYHKQSKSAKISEEYSIIKNKNLSRKSFDIPIVKPSSKEDTIDNFNEYNYLTLNSVVPILYNPYKKNSWMICPFWNVWRRNHWLDDFHNYQDGSENEEFYKQRIISEENLFQDELPFNRKTILIALIILAISLLNRGIFFIVAIIECCLFLMRFTWVKFYFPRHHDFYEYSVATMGIITSATEIKEREGKNESKYWLYKYKFTTQNGIPYQGQMKVSISDNIIPYEKNSHATILYDPYCILQNCLAFYYPYSWIQPEETKNLYQIPIIQPDDTNNI